MIGIVFVCVCIHVDDLGRSQSNTQERNHLSTGRSGLFCEVEKR